MFICMCVYIDINECLPSSPCDHFCDNTQGSYNCRCFDGYNLVNYHTCEGQ